MISWSMAYPVYIIMYRISHVARHLPSWISVSCAESVTLQKWSARVFVLSQTPICQKHLSGCVNDATFWLTLFLSFGPLQVHVARCLVLKNSVHPAKVVILSPYREQRSRISVALQGDCTCKDILVTTIAKSQGNKSLSWQHHIWLVICAWFIVIVILLR